MTTTGPPHSSDQSRRLLHALDTAVSKLQAAERARNEPIAIVGMGCRFPGSANSPQEFWELLDGGVDAITDIPQSRWNIDDYFDPDPLATGRMYVRQGGFVDGIDKFDARFFGISGREAASLDPQQRLLLEVGWEAFENASIAPDSLRGSRTAIFVGISTNDYSRLLTESSDSDPDAWFSTGNALNAAAGRMAHFFGSRGPAIAVDTACSSSLVSVHTACRSLRSAESDVALAGGVNLLLCPEITVAVCRARMLAADGRCRTFDSQASGYVRSEGCGLVVLKRLSDAESDGDRILAVIRGSALNHDGASSGFTVPSGTAQEELLREALANAQVEPHEIDYLEAHGTGTSLGDPIELNAIGRVLATDRQSPLLVGSVKTNIGHLEASAGIAGLMKVVLAMQHERIPPHLHFERPSPHIDWDDFRLTVPTKSVPWSAESGPRMAGVSSFGFSGTNAHIILEARSADRPESGRRGRTPEAAASRQEAAHLLTLSAQSERALYRLAERYRDFPADTSEAGLSDFCCAANTGRADLDYRIHIVVPAGSSVRSALQRRIERWDSNPPQKQAGVLPGLAMICRGDGRALLEPCRALYRQFAGFRNQIRDCDEALASVSSSSIEYLLKEAASFPSDPVESALAGVALEVSLARFWVSLGFQPRCLLASGPGEIVAACLSGMVSMADGFRLLAHCARSQASSANGRSDLRSDRSYSQPDIAIISAAGKEPYSASATNQDIEKHFAAALRTAGQIDAAIPRLAEHDIRIVLDLSSENERPNDVSVDQSPAETASRTADVMERQDAHRDRGNDGQVSGSASTEQSSGERRWLSIPRGGCTASEAVLRNIGVLYECGATINWSEFYRDHEQNHVTLPTYPFERQSHWFTRSSPAGHSAAEPDKARAHPLTGQRVSGTDAAEITFASAITAANPGYLRDHQVFGTAVLPAAAFLEMALSAGVAVTGRTSLRLSDVAILQPLVLHETQPSSLQVRLNSRQDGAYEFKIVSQDEGSSAHWTMHATGQLDANSGADKPSDAADVGLWDGPARVPVDVNAVYAEHAARGIQYGPGFRAMQEVETSAESTLARIELPETVKAAGNEHSGYVFHPVLLDASFHILGVVAGGEGDGAVYVPVGVDSLQLYSPVPSNVYCRVDADSVRHTNGSSLALDLRLYTDIGTPVAVLQGLQLHRVTPEFLLPAHNRTNSDDWLYDIAWQPCAGSVDGIATDGCRNWLILSDRDGMGQEIQQQLAQIGDECTLIFAGDEYCRQSATEFVVDPLSREDIQLAVQESLRSGVSRFDGVVVLWSLDADDPGACSGAELQSDVIRECSGVLHLVQILNSQFGADGPPLRLVSRGAQRVRSSDLLPGVSNAPLWGLGKVIALEHPEFRCRCIDLDPAANQSDALPLIRELLSENDSDFVALRGSERFVARLRRFRTPKTQRVETLSLRGDGTYLVTGGFGALGLYVAKWLVDNGAQSLVLMGRSQPSAAARTTIDQLRLLGVSVCEFIGDVSDAGQVQDCFEEISRSLPRLCGVIHLAGVLDDGVLLHQSVERFRRVLDPKVAGAWNLHRSTMELPLDCFVMFSGVASLLGSPGQGNYSAANSFLDSLAAYRAARGLPALSVSWGGWSQTGMAARQRVENQFQRHGMQSIPPLLALDVLQRLMVRKAVYVGVMPVDWPALLRSSSGESEIPLLREMIRQARDADPGTADSDGDLHSLRNQPAGQRHAQLTTDVRELAAGILRSPVHELGTKEFLNSAGLDSLMAIELRNRLRSRFDVDVSIAAILDDASVVSLVQEIEQHWDSHAAGASESGAVPKSNAPRRITPAAVLHSDADIDPESAAQLLADLEYLSNDDVTELLRKIRPELSDDSLRATEALPNTDEALRV